MGHSSCISSDYPMPVLPFEFHIFEQAAILYPVFSLQLMIASFPFLLGIQACAVISFRGIDRAKEHKISFHVFYVTELKATWGHNSGAVWRRASLRRNATYSIPCACPPTFTLVQLCSHICLFIIFPPSQYGFYCIFKISQISLKNHGRSCCFCSWMT